MLTPQLTDTLVRCEGYCRGGHYSAALTELGTLPDIDRCEPAVVSMETPVCQMPGKWDRGLKRAYLCEFADGDEYQITAAEFHAAYAAHLCGEGQIERAKFYVKVAARVFPPIRLELLDDPTLAPIFGGINLP